MQPYLDTANGPISLHLRRGLQVAPGTLVSIKHPTFDHATIVDGDVARLAPPTTPPPVGSKMGPANFKAGPRKVVVILVKVGSQPAPGNVDAIRNIIFTGPNSANAFVQQETFGQLSLTGKLRSDGDIYGPYPVTMTPNVCDPGAWGTDAEKAFKTATGLDAETWDNVVFVFQAAFTLCPFTGQGEIGQLGTGARHVWINAVLSNGVPTTSVVAHELGHNFGVDHAGALNCDAGSGRTPFTVGCAESEMSTLADEYGDPFDVMGTGAREESAYHRWESGWLPSASVQTVLRSGTYLLAPVETASKAVQLLEVPRSAYTPSYWLDFRQPLAGWFDTFLPTDPVVNGVTIRYANSSIMAHPAKSWLIDTTPGTTTFDDAPLGVGQTYSEPAQGVSITTLAVSPLGALVKITIANGGDSTPPGPPTDASASLVAGTLQLTWAGATDDSGPVQHFLVYRNGTQIADVYDTSATDPTPLAGSTSYDIVAIDPAGNQSTPARVLVTIADSAPPSAPTGLVASLTGPTVHLSWSPAVDNVGVASYEVDRDGESIATGLQATALSDPGLTPGTHTYAVRAVDAAGNAGAFAQVSVVLVSPAAVVPVPKTRVKTVTSLKLKRLGRHRVLVSWKAQRGAHRYQVLRAGKHTTLLATIQKVQYLDGHAPTGKLAKSRYVVRAVLN
jgi:Metallo-peptidase family M12B Reprolysin-like